MASIQEIREKRARAAQKARDLFPTTDDGKPDFNVEWTDEKQNTYKAAIAEVESLDLKLKNAEQFISRLSDDETAQAQVQTAADQANITVDKATRIKQLQDAEMDLFMRGGFDGAAVGENRSKPRWKGTNSERGEEIRNEINRLNAAGGSHTAVEGDQVGSGGDNKAGGGDGGYLVPRVEHAVLLDKMKWFGGMREASSVMTVSDGRTQYWPTTDSTNVRGSIVSEKSNVGERDMTFGQVKLDFDMYTSNILEVSRELLQDANVDVVSHIRSRLAEALARIQNDVFTNGYDDISAFATTADYAKGDLVTNGGKTLRAKAAITASAFVAGEWDDVTSEHPDPASTSANVRGIIESLGTASVYKASDSGITTAAGGKVTFAELLQVIYSLDRSYRMGGSFMFGDQTELQLKLITLEGSTGSKVPLWLPSISADGIGSGPTIWGVPYTLNSDMPMMAAKVKGAIIYGDLKKYQILDAMGYELHRLEDSPYIRRRTVGFLAYMRSAGTLIDIGGAVKFLNQK